MSKLTLPITVGQRCVRADKTVATVRLIEDGIAHIEGALFPFIGSVFAATGKAWLKVECPTDFVADCVVSLGPPVAIAAAAPVATAAGCPHAALILLYAHDAAKTAKPWELWEFSQTAQRWLDLAGHPHWEASNAYRRKPEPVKIIRIGAIGVPEPMRVAPALEAKFWLVNVGNKDGPHERTWTNTETEKHWLAMGLCQSTFAGATSQTIAWLESVRAVKS